MSEFVKLTSGAVMAILNSGSDGKEALMGILGDMRTESNELFRWTVATRDELDEVRARLRSEGHCLSSFAKLIGERKTGKNNDYLYAEGVRPRH
jgi:hypothetical protein